ncbi:mCG1036929, isoform CRA_a, partial [Mus musculus]
LPISKPFPLFFVVDLAATWRANLSIHEKNKQAGEPSGAMQDRSRLCPAAVTAMAEWLELGHKATHREGRAPRLRAAAGRPKLFCYIPQ